jgi:hypothetical protein
MSVKTDTKRMPDGAQVLAKEVTDGRVSLRIRALNEKTTNLAMTFFREGENMAGEVRAYVNGAFVSSISEGGESAEIVMDDITLREGVNEISFEFGGDISGVFAVGPEFLRH